MKIVRKGHEMVINIRVSTDGTVSADIIAPRGSGLPNVSGWATQLSAPEKQNNQWRETLKKAGKSEHWVFGSMAGAIALSPNEAVELQAEFEVAKANWTPGIDYWIEQRNKIARDIHYSREAAQEARDKSYESGDGTGRWVNAGDKYDQEADRDAQKLDEFDAAHPEVIIEIRRRRSESAERNMWN